jgi:hypothetical protein
MITQLPQPSAEQIGKAISALLPSDLIYIPHLASAGLMGCVAKRLWHNSAEIQRGGILFIDGVEKQMGNNFRFRPASIILRDLLGFQATAEVNE